MRVLNECVRAGDLLLCYEDIDRSAEKTGESGYIHVAIVLDSEKILEADMRGIRYTTTNELLKSFEYLAVLRQTEVWSSQKLNDLKEFAENCIGKKFNLVGMKRVSQRKEESSFNSLERIQNYFNGNGERVNPFREVYFCSELVVSAFIYLGIIDSAASVVSQPETLSPQDIGKDKTFGFFIGYLLKDNEYKVHESDYFQTSI